MSVSKFASPFDADADDLPPVPGADQIYPAPVPRRGNAIIPDNALVKREDGAFVYKQFVMTATGMDIPEGTDAPAWDDVGLVLRGMESAVSWWVADWAAYAHRVWGATAKEIAEAFGYEVETIEPYMSVGLAVPGLIRNQAVSFSHCRRVAKMAEGLQRRWINLSARHRLTLEAFKVEIRAIDSLDYDGKVAKLDAALSQNLLITQLPGIKRPTPPKVDKTEKQVHTFTSYVKTEQDNVPYMNEQQRKDFADRAQWLSEHYRKLALWALGQEE